MGQSAKRACSCDRIPRIFTAMRCPIPGKPRKGCQGSSAVEQGTHKPLVGSSILPPGTTTPSRPPPCLPCVVSPWDVCACGSHGLGCGRRDKSSLARGKRPCRVAPGFHSVSPLRASVAQLDRASDYGSEGSRFNSWRMRQLLPQALLDASPSPSPQRVVSRPRDKSARSKGIADAGRAKTIGLAARVAGRKPDGEA